MLALLLLVPLCVISVTLARAYTARPPALRLRARLLLWAAMAPGNGGRPRPILWLASQEAHRRAEGMDAAERERRRLRAAIFAMSLCERQNTYAPPLPRREWPGSSPVMMGANGHAAQLALSGPCRLTDRPNPPLAETKIHLHPRRIRDNLSPRSWRWEPRVSSASASPRRPRNGRRADD
jgi:hypothetical protein